MSESESESESEREIDRERQRERERDQFSIRGGIDIFGGNRPSAWQRS